MQLYESVSNSLLCGFQTAHSTQHALSKLLQAWEKSLTNVSLLAKYLWIYLKRMTA